MSLDLYLNGPTERIACTCECGHEHQKDWAPTLFDTNITHNLGPMFEAAGVYQILWHGDDQRAGDVLPKLRAALQYMEAEPNHFKKFDSPNGWGLYKHAVPWLREVIAGFEENPDGVLRCSR